LWQGYTVEPTLFLSKPGDACELHFLFLVLAWLAGVHQAAAQGMRFFRIAGPAATTIRAIRADGTLVWNNALAGTNYTVQMATSLNASNNWLDYLQLLVISGVNTNRNVSDANRYFFRLQVVQ
jgi:hypothetical protein